MRRRRPDERCGLCEAAPFRPCRFALPGFWHFQPAGFRPELPRGQRTKSSGRLATDFERMARDGRVARAFAAIEDRAIRSKLSAARAAGKVGVR